MGDHPDNKLATWFLDNTNKDFAYEYHKTFIQMLNSVDAPKSHGSYPIVDLTRLGLHMLVYQLHMQRAYFDNYKGETVANKNTILELIRRVTDVFIDRVVQFRRTNKDTPIIDIIYNELMAQSIDMIRLIYNHFGLTWSDEFEQGMINGLRENAQGTQGRNAYTPHEFGFNRQEIEKYYHEYNNIFLKTED